MRGKSIGRESASRGRLEDDRWPCCGQIFDDGFTPASMMRQLNHIAREIDLSSRMHSGEPCGGLRLDVAGEEEAERRITIAAAPLDHDDERKIVVSPRSELRIRPERGPRGGTDLDRIAARELHDARRPRP
jgi:hypothetical protein